MTVNSLFFLLFLAVLYVVYYVCPLKYRWMVLLGASVFFYALACAASPVYLLLTSITIWAAGLWMERLEQECKRMIAEKKNTAAVLKKQYKKKKKKILTIAVVFNLGILLILKYSGFFVRIGNQLFAFTGVQLPVPQFLIPLGISYYTLIAISYLMDIYKGKIQAQKNYAKLLLFLAYFPQMTQGPMNRYKPMAAQLYEGHVFDYHNFSYGCQRMLWGFFKKMVVADNLRPVMQSIFDQYAELSGITCFLGCVYMTVWMYADFSGYMDIVAGASELFGIHIEENFRRPFFSESLAEYWRRWHITLGAWFRDYMFYPLAVSSPATKFGKLGRKWFGARVGKLFPSLFALVFVWTSTGLWHAASWRYILWGAANGVFIMGAMILEPYFAKAKELLHIRQESRGWKLFSIARTFFLVSILKIFPGPASTAEMLQFAKKMFTDIRMPAGWSEILPGLSREMKIFLGCALLLMFAVDILQEKQPVRDTLAKRLLLVRWFCYFFVLGVILAIGQINVSMTGGFAYAQF